MDQDEQGNDFESTGQHIERKHQLERRLEVGACYPGRQSDSPGRGHYFEQAVERLVSCRRT